MALAQAVPGPKVLFVALMGWNMELNAGGGLADGWHAVALAGVTATVVGILPPSSVLTCSATRWAHRNREQCAGAPSRRARRRGRWR